MISPPPASHLFTEATHVQSKTNYLSEYCDLSFGCDHNVRTATPPLVCQEQSSTKAMLWSPALWFGWLKLIPGCRQKRKQMTEDSIFSRALNPGVYSLRVEKPGFQTSVQQGLLLQVDMAATINVALKVGASSQAVTVTGQGTQINLRSSTQSYEITAQMIKELPLNGRNVLQLMTLAPDVSRPIPAPRTLLSSPRPDLRLRQDLFPRAGARGTQQPSIWTVVSWGPLHQRRQRLP